jgi:hypothetical protein
MTHLVYDTDVPCGPEDANFTAFIEATSLIGDRDAVEEFLASSLWPLSQQFGFEVRVDTDFDQLKIWVWNASKL